MARKRQIPDKNQLSLIETNPGRVRTKRTRLPIFLERFLRERADDSKLRGPASDNARQIMLKWAKLEDDGHLTQKETSLDAEFLHDVFRDALGYSDSTQAPEEYHLERNFTVPGMGIADGALGMFRPGEHRSPHAVIELKGAAVDLDRDKFNGRTPVQQCWDYLNSLPDCPWGIVSNFVTIRLYHRDRTPRAYEEFSLQKLKSERRFSEFYYLFEKGGLLPTKLRRPRALQLLEESGERQREVGDALYGDYNRHRLHLIHHLRFKLDKSIESSIKIAQRLLDRIIFIAFCEDRGLLPPDTLKTAHEKIPPFSKATNPRWSNFLELFHAIDRGDKRLGIENGYNGGLFEHDPEVDDLQLDDDWTGFFKEVGTYDFRDEINVEVLGHLFERSVTELERIRSGGLFGNGADDEPPKKTMRKSAQRKRHGIFYTGKDFTSFIVERTVGYVIKRKLGEVMTAHGLSEQERDATEPSAKAGAYWRGCLEALRSIKVCDPACGSGAFLIQAYEVFEGYYQDIVDALLIHDGVDAEALMDEIPDIILSHNLYGVDLSLEAVEISQLALWIRSARRGRKLSDLSKNIVSGNSLVSDSAVDERAMTWQETFSDVFQPPEGGFDCVIGNPPWERLKLQEREFFSHSAPDIGAAVNAAKRRKLIAALEKKNPQLYTLYLEEKGKAEKTLAHVRDSGRFPLTARGDINTYILFAELARSIVSPTGRVGLLTPSGIATDKTTKEFFNAIIDDERLISFHDFENKEAVFPDVHRSFKFCTLVFGGEQEGATKADFVFFARNMSHVADRRRHIELSKHDFKLLNPNTRTCPIFRTRRDADLTRSIYNRVPVLVDKSRGEKGNPWGIRFLRMFDQTNDAELFKSPQELKKLGYKLVGNRWTKRKKTYLPLYEAKMVQAYDHRAASVIIEPDNWMRQGQTVATTSTQHQNTDFVGEPRWWIESIHVDKVIRRPARTSYISFKDVTSPTNQRTMIAAFIPHAGALNSLPLLITDEEFDEREDCCLLANLNSFALDFVARQKVGNIHLNFFIVEQLPVLAPDIYEQRFPWTGRQTLLRWVSDHVLKLTCTAEDMRPLGEACGLKPPVQKWNERKRSELLAELDAAYFHLYGIGHDDAEYILSTFQEFTDWGRTDINDAPGAQLILDKFDSLTS